MKHKLTLLALAIMLSFPHASYAQHTAPAVAPAIAHHSHKAANSNHKGQAAVETAFQAWIAALSTGSSDAILKLYAPDAYLLPTLSPQLHNTPELRKAYFDKLTKRENLKATVKENHIRMFSGIAINSGLYDFSFTDDGDTKTIPARFTFVYHHTPKGWMIVEHHSSVLPE